MLVTNRVLNYSARSSKDDTEFWGSWWSHLWAISFSVLGKTRDKVASLIFWSIILSQNDAIWMIGSPIPSNTGSWGSLNLVGISVSNILLTKGNDASMMHSSSFLGLVLAFCITSSTYRVSCASCKAGILVLDDSPSLSFRTSLCPPDPHGMAAASWLPVFSS